KEIKKETKPLAGTAEAPSVKTPIVPEKDKIAYSVVPVSASLTPEERSSVLSLEIPSNSATFKALSAQRTLYAVFRFERKSLELTHEMQTVLNDIAVQMKKNRKKRLIVYSYGSPDSAEPGKERQYALRRALLIRSYLIEQGLHSLRIELRSQGQKGAGNKIPDRADLVFQER
ncbi:MAG: OmpA family protein, partial [Alphaproteobacteria bacterium]|nr:OmpA family protein [Alphaproteobacteria bacterium]